MPPTASHPFPASSTTTRRRTADLLSRDEIAALTERSNWRGTWAIASTWSVIAAAMALLAYQPNALTFLIALLVIGGRQLALAILEHEAAHGTLFRTRWMNAVLGDWLCARPIWQDVAKYRTHHMLHHTHTGTAQDSDRSLIAPFPITRSALARKLLRDVTGLTGLKVLYGRLLMDAGLIRWTVASEVEWLPRNERSNLQIAGAALRNMIPMLMTNGLLLAALSAAGHAWLYGVWVLAYLTTFTLFVRIRAIAEHACTENSPDVLRNTRSTRAGWLARLTVAPMYVNLHREHHLLASAPYYRLPALHRLLRERDALPMAPGYLSVLHTVTEPRTA
ncbi:fatty acid desaturase [Sinimarinibacterium sp. CAU 1509]|uniref:fatty acid desaturase family protein n=1 Tax=Sinimarinibacterium sp. CAU 1509 TaxID=2562283 RepID=UPI0010ACBC9E|nr:fatty acid desaturase family protein [Sinimarinibacterium sp. CAU 1509]TJY64990.1 fatty acid desaturase [Sinimarinibacterium sp. CAU 1509]